MQRDHPEWMMPLRSGTGKVPVMDFDDLGFGFYAKLAGVFLLGAIALIFVFIFFTRAVYAWGLFGAFLLLAAVEPIEPADGGLKRIRARLGQRARRAVSGLACRQPAEMPARRHPRCRGAWPPPGC